MCNTIATDIITQLIFPEYSPASSRSNITKSIPTEFQPGSLWFRDSQVPVRKR